VKGIRVHRMLALGGIAALVIVYPLLWLRMIRTPAERSGSDFIAFYAAGRVAQEHGLPQVYEALLQQSVQEQVVGFPLVPGQVLLYNHVPYLLPLLIVVVSPAYAASFVRWMVVLLVLFILAALLLARLLQRRDWHRRQTLVPAAGMLLFFPAFVSLMNGQDSAFTTLGLCLWLYGLLTGRDAVAGLGLALVTVRPHIALMLAVPFLMRHGRVLLWFAAGSAALGLISLLLLGWQGVLGFVDLLRVTAGGEFYGMNESAMVNLVGVLTRLFPGMDADPIRWIGWGAYLAGMLCLCLLWRRSRTLDERHFSLAVLLAIFLAPHLHYHDLALLLIPLVGCMLTLERSGWADLRTAGLLPLGCSLCLLLGSLVPGLKYNLPAVLIAILALALWVPAKAMTRVRNDAIPS
jgi:hypothetical protein